MSSFPAVLACQSWAEFAEIFLGNSLTLAEELQGYPWKYIPTGNKFLSLPTTGPSDTAIHSELSPHSSVLPVP